jgi:cystathionine beta-lyase
MPARTQPLEERADFAMKDDTKLVTGGRHPHDHFGAVNTPVYRASTILHPTLDDLENEKQPYTYGRKATPTTASFEEAICTLEGGARTLLTPSGLSAVTCAILSTCNAGDHLLMTDGCYAPVRLFCDRVLKRFGIETTYYVPLVGAGIAAQLRPNTKVIFAESPSSLTFEVQDVPAFAQIARSRNLTLILDNTWATPLYFKGLSHGVDISVIAATKYVSGHSDANIGTVTVQQTHRDQVVETHARLGLTASGDEVYLAHRGLRTMAVRMERQGRTGLKLAQFLKSRSEIRRVLHPALEDDPGHALWRRDFTGTAGVFGVELKPCSQTALAKMFDGLELFGMGYSWGGYESLIVPSNPRRSARKFETEGPLLRISTGLEDPDDLIADLTAGLKRLASV